MFLAQALGFLSATKILLHTRNPRPWRYCSGKQLVTDPSRAEPRLWEVPGAPRSRRPTAVVGVLGRPQPLSRSMKHGSIRTNRNARLLISRGICNLRILHVAPSRRHLSARHGRAPLGSPEAQVRISLKTHWSRYQLKLSLYKSLLLSLRIDCNKIPTEDQIEDEAFSDSFFGNPSHNSLR